MSALVMPTLVSLMMSLTTFVGLLLVGQLNLSRWSGPQQGATQATDQGWPQRARRRMERVVERLMPQPLRAAIQRQLCLAGRDGVDTPARWVARQLLISASCAAMLLALGATGEHLSPHFGVLIAVLISVLPYWRLHAAGRRRLQSILRSLPAYLDLLTLGLEAGLGFGAALQIAVERGAPGPLKAELRQVLQELRAGRTRREALAQLVARNHDESLATLVSSVAQADAVGASLVTLLRSHAERSLQQRFARAEKLALEAPVKMLAPLICCIFPCTFLVVGFPIAAKLFWGA